MMIHFLKNTAESTSIKLDGNSQVSRNYKISFLEYLTDGRILEKDSLYLKDLKGRYFELTISHEYDIDSKIVNLKFAYNSGIKVHLFLIRGHQMAINEICIIIQATLDLCLKNGDSIENFGFRDNIKGYGLANAYKFGRREDFLVEILRLKTYELFTSINRVGKDNVFRDYMVIQYEQYHPIYFLKLISDFFVRCVHDKEKMTFTKETGEHRAWSAWFADKKVENKFEITRIKLIEFILENYNNEEDLKISILNINV